MGLDMYFDKQKKVDGYTFSQIMNAPYYYGDEYDEEAKEYYNLTKEDCDKLEKLGIGGGVEVAYFRKFNALHNWMVNNVQGGEDDCGCYEVDKGTLHELLDILKEIKDTCVLVPYKEVDYSIEPQRLKEIEKYYGDEFKMVKNPEICEELLPCVDGFFFGSTSYDEYYMSCVEDAIDQLSNISLADDEVLLYCSSW